LGDSSGIAGEAGPWYTGIRAERKRLGVTQKQLAMTAGVGLRYLIELERGKPTARIEGVFKVLQALGLKMSVITPSETTGSEAR
jgi:HTH-type transcriptional regulator/antitoxin HipB